MARTKASVGAKVSSGKSSKARAVCAPPPTTPSTNKASGSSSNKYSGGNPVCPRETPAWQKPITRFFNQAAGDEAARVQPPEEHQDGEEPGPSKEKPTRRPRKNVITSDDECEEQVQSTNAIVGHNTSVLDVSVELLPLDGESSHKLEEYYPTKNGGKKYKKTKKSNKENSDENAKRNSISKRDLDEISKDDSFETNASKKVKVSI